MHSLVTNLLILWVGTAVLAFATFMAWGFSIHDGGLGDRVGVFISPIILIAATVITILKLTGVIGLWI